MRDMRNAYKVLAGKPEERIPFAFYLPLLNCCHPFDFSGLKL
jgi:hypothetical protein